MKIPTKDTNGQPNGNLQLLWNSEHNPSLRPEQVYVTGIAPGCRKGPHLHKIRRGLFACVHGQVLLRVSIPGSNVYADTVLVPGNAPVQVDPGSAAAFYNYGSEEALVVNMPSPAWSAADDFTPKVWEDPTPEALLNCGIKPATQQCEFCGHFFSYPVQYHHTEEECNESMGRGE